LRLDAADLRDLDRALATEWLVADGAGGYASSTVLGCPARRYHGLWVPALAPPVDRRVVLSHVDEHLVADGAEAWLSTTEYPGGLYPDGSRVAQGFDLEPFPRFLARAHGVTVDREVLLRRDGAGVCLTYRVEAAGAWTLDLAPMLALRPMHHLEHRRATLRAEPTDGACGFHVLSEGMPGVFAWTDAAAAEASVNPTWYENVLARIERERGFDFTQDLLAPGRWTIRGRGPAEFHLFCSFDPPGAMDVAAERAALLRRQAHLAARAGWPTDPPRQGRLVAAADAFLVRRRAGGDDLATVIAGYPWFGDWGRDTMIALPGLAIETGRLDLAEKVLQAFAAATSEGMIPNRFAEETGRPEYNTVDASLWFIQAAAAYARAGGSRGFVRRRLWPAAREIIEYYAAGTRFGIHADADGLIAAGSPDTQLTWMDAKSAGRPVTPRHGKAVEIQALWLSGLALVEEMAAALGEAPPAACASRAKTRDAFEALFWNDEAACLYDCVLPDAPRDASIRPNQVFAVGLPHAPLAGARAKAVVRMVREKLLTPRGLRTLSPDDPAYKGTYRGGPDQRDAAYHQGTAWPWLLGPYVDAVFAAESRRCARGEAAQVLAGLLDSMHEAGLGQIGEVFDGDPPHRPGGCIAQAWSVAAAIHVWRRLEATGGVPR